MIIEFSAKAGLRITVTKEPCLLYAMIVLKLNLQIKSLVY